MTKFKFYGVRGTHDGEFYFSVWTWMPFLPTMFQDSSDTFYEFTGDGIIAMQFSSQEVILLRDVLVAVVVVAS